MPSTQTKLAARRLLGLKPPGHSLGSYGDGGWVDPKPYTDVYANGLFEGYDGQLCQYFKMPNAVKIEWTHDVAEAVANQHFFVEMVDGFARRLEEAQTTEKVRGDLRRSFHIQYTKSFSPGIEPYDGITPMHKSYFERMSSRYTKPDWTGYIGIQILTSSGFYEAHSLRSKFERWKEMMSSPDALQMHLYRQDLSEVQSFMLDLGFRSLHFDTPEGRSDFERLTAWHGVSDDMYGMPKELSSTRFTEPVHGLSIITPKWGEITAHAIHPVKNTFMIDPQADSAKWGSAIYKPGSGVVAINIRGDIRAASVAENLMDSKRLKRQSQREKVGRSVNVDENELREKAKQVSTLDYAKAAARFGHGLLDNVEIVAFTQVKPGVGVNQSLNVELKPYSLQAAPLVNRQPQAISSTIPMYPVPIFPHHQNNTVRSPLANELYAGVIAMSGLFRHTKPAASRGIVLGLSYGASQEYLPVMTEIEAANKYHQPPGFLVTGRPGAGKTMEMQQIFAQVIYSAYRGVYLNPKRTGTLQYFFDAIGGMTINMGYDYLREHPGLMDPVYFFKKRERVASTLYNAISMTGDLMANKGLEARTLAAKLRSKLHDGAIDPRNRNSSEIIFGNKDTEWNGIENPELEGLIRNNINSSPFWKSFISTSDYEVNDMAEKMREGGALLIEWDSSMELPSQETIENLNSTGRSMESAQIDSFLSVNLAFEYATEMAGADRMGGLIAVDEAWVLKASQQSMSLVERGLREMRESNIMFMLGTQYLKDFQDYLGLFPRQLIMAIPSKSDHELDLFYKITNLPRNDGNTRFIQNAGIMKEDENGRGGQSMARTIPLAYYVDSIYGFEGAILCGPWPEEELNMARTDKGGRQSRNFTQESNDDLGGVLGEVYAEDFAEPEA